MAGAVAGDGQEESDRAAARATFVAAYDRMVQRFPRGTEEIDVTSDFGNTRVHVSGPADAPPLVLLHAYQASSAEWFALTGLLSHARRTYAVDLVGDAGYSTPGPRSVATPADLVEYLDGVLDGLGLTSSELCGHSFGAWIALTYGINRPTRVDRLILLDPTMSVAPLLKGYVFRAIPALYKPSAANRLSLIRWETRKVELDPEWLAVTGAAADAFSGLPSVPTKIPNKAALAGLQMPVLVVVAGRSRVHHVRRVAKRSGRMPFVRVETVDGASHYGLPMTHADQVAALILQGGEN